MRDAAIVGRGTLTEIVRIVVDIIQKQNIEISRCPEITPSCLVEQREIGEGDMKTGNADWDEIEKANERENIDNPLEEKKFANRSRGFERFRVAIVEHQDFDR
jgi:hypothetical protein